MGGTKEGGLSAYKTNTARYGPDYYSRIGAAGGAKCNKIDPVTGKALKGFAVSNKASAAGKLGGIKSRRNKSTTDII